MYSGNYVARSGSGREQGRAVETYLSLGCSCNGTDSGNGAGHDQGTRTSQHQDQKRIVQCLGPQLVHGKGRQDKAKSCYSQ